MHTVRDGLFLIDTNLKIGSQYSKAMEVIFRRKRFEGMKFEKLLKQIVPEKTLQVATDYIGLLFGDRVNEKLIRTLNPLSEVEVHFEEGPGGFETHYLEFEFNRVKMGDELHHVLVTVNDVSDRVMLRRELEDSKESSQVQLDLLMEILHVDPKVLIAFLDEAETAMTMVNGILQQPARKHEEYSLKLDDIFRQVHGVKGDAGALGLSAMESRAHSFEDMLTELRDLEKLTGNDFLSLTVKLDDILNHMASVRGLISKLSELRAAINRETGSPTPAVYAAAADSSTPAAAAAGVGSTATALKTLAARVATDQGKHVVVCCIGIDEDVPEPYRKGIKDITVQMVRNSVTHGIEEPQDRVAADKPQKGNVHVEFHDRGETGFELTFFDDGRGLSADLIRVAAIRKGIISPEQGNAMDSRKLLSLIFKPGFSTSETVTRDAGRGVGMDLVRNAVNSLGGSLRMSTMAGQNTQFRVLLPPVQEKASAVA